MTDREKALRLADALEAVEKSMRHDAGLSGDESDGFRFLSMAAAMIRAVLDEREWKTIDSAPMDGARFLAYEGGAHYAAFFDDMGLLNSECGQYVTETPEPTHWMTLPSSPRILSAIEGHDEEGE